MPGPRPALCTFPEDFLQEALDTVSRRTVAVQTVQRFRLVLLLHEQPSLGNDEAAEAVGLSARQVQRWRSRWATGDFSIEVLTPNDFATLDAVRLRLALYEQLSNRTPRPFAWKFTRQDLLNWLKRAAPHFLAASAA